MKKLFLNITLICIVSSNLLTAQTGKPQYLVDTRRADTTYGHIVIELFPLVAPKHAAYFDSLVNIQFYDSTAFHRVVPDFVIQGGDPNSRHGDRSTWGNGDPSQMNIPAEFSKIPQVRGTIGAARDEDINSANSQFYINIVDNVFLTSNYTCYGQVVEGMDIADSIVDVPRDENDNPLEKIEMFVIKLGINDSVPEVPNVLLPADGEEGLISNIKLEWECVEGALLYDLEVSKGTDFSELVFTDSIVTSSFYLADVETGLVTYYWRVRANNGGNKSEFSVMRSFITAIASPVLVYPPNRSDSVETDTELIWNQVEGASNYSVQVATSPTFSTSKTVFDTGGLTDTTVTVSGLDEGTKYYWRVLGGTDTYEGPKSDVWNFTTLQSTGITESDEVPESYSLDQNYPNPFNPVTTIEYCIHTPASGFPSREVKKRGVFVELKVYDILGHEIATLVDEQQNPGTYRVKFDGANLGSGIYYYKLISGDFSETKKMVLLR